MEVYDIFNNFKDAKEEWVEGKSSYWILINSQEFPKILDVILLDAESIIECIDSKQPSKISFFDGYIFMVCNILSYDNKTVKPKELNIFLSKNYIITVYKQKIDIIEKLKRDVEVSKDCFILKGRPNASVLLYYILDRVIIRNYDIISSLEAQADKIELSILKMPKQEQIHELINLRRQVYKIRKYLSPLRYIGDSLISNENNIIEKENMSYFFTINNKIEKLMASLESLVQDLALVREAFESEIANKTNELMKVFTIIATIFLPLNLITSMYGMNFQNIPFVTFKYGYYFILGAMICISILLIIMFRKKGWL